ncbi:50S ribosomal protein L2 [Parcubacteria bacterium DG_72]|nr:MAG: 50S ribosomal protein L2 [Parcubacteria bacterium DG_72]
MRKKVKTKKILSKKKPEKRLLLTLKSKAGRNKQGRITVRHRGGGVKRRYRIVDFGQNKIDILAKVTAIEYDPYRTAFLMLLEYKDGEKRYCLAPEGIKIGEEIICKDKAVLKRGNRMKIKNIPVGTGVFNVELIPGQGGKIIRSAGSSAKILAHEEKYTNLQMPSGEIRKVNSNCFATIGEVSHSEWRYVKIGKAGTSRRKGKRPTVRGSAMNPVDHPHGGGEGKSSIGLRHPKTPWGKPALGVKTRKRKKWTNKLIIKRRKKK